MDLGKHVLDKELVDRELRRAGRVDDLVIEVAELGPDGSIPPPEVTAIVCGPMALCPNLSPPFRRLAHLLYRGLGLSDPRPVEIPWSAVSAIDVVVHVDIDREQWGTTALATAVRRRYIGRLPGA